MVVKQGKYGVRSGNTLKASNTRYRRKYLLQSLLIRTVQTDGEVNGLDKYLEADHVTSSEVPYSLNKKGRWLLPEILKESVSDVDNLTKGFGIQLVEHHKLTKSSNCISIYSSTNLDAGSFRGSSKIRQKYHGYVHSKSILNNNRYDMSRRQIRDRRRRGRGLLVETTPENGETNANHEKHEMNVIRYQVFHPGPANSSVTCIPRYIGFSTRKPFIWRGYQDGIGKQKNIWQTENMIREALSCMDTLLYDSEEDEELGNLDDEEELECRSQGTVRSHGTILFEDLLTHVRLAKTPNGKGTRKRNSNKYRVGNKASFKKDHIVYEAHGQSYTDAIHGAPVKTVSIPISPRAESVSVILPGHQVDPYYLTQCYGNRYRECGCFPRKFIVDISEEVSNIDSFKSFYGDDVGRVNACVVFVFDVKNKINNLRENVYNVSLNTNFNGSKQTVTIETMFNYMTTSVTDVIRRTVFFIETLPLDALAFEKVPYTNIYKRNHIPSCLEETAKWKSHSYRPCNSYYFDSFIGDSVRNADDNVLNSGDIVPNSGDIVPNADDIVSNASSDEFDVVSRVESFRECEIVDKSSPMNAYCGVCYDSLLTKRGTALILCKHWFCDDCWVAHLETRVRSGAVTLPCPEYNCDKHVDAGTALTLLNMRDIIKFTKCCYENNVEKKTITKWCPNVKCGRVIEVDTNATKMACCACGREVCFDCMGSPHWPASCKAVAKYYQTLRDTGDAELLPDEFITPIVVNGKRCPFCRRFIEKSGGCSVVICVCQNALCWGCGKGLRTSRHDESCVDNGGWEGNAYKTKIKEIQYSRNTRGLRKWYSVALSHRLDKHPLKIEAMKSKVKSISKKLQTYMLRKAYEGNPIQLDLEVSDRKFAREVDKVPLFLANAILLHTEIHRLVENTALVLDSDSLDKASRGGLTNAITRLSKSSSVIYELFMSDSTISVGDLLTKLQEVRVRSNQAIKCLIKSVNTSRL